jgi:hypothetical protein
MTRALLFLVTFCIVASAAAQERWATYANARFGTTVDYPANLFPQRDPPPANSDGQGFRSRDGRVHLSVWGHYNINDDTPESYVKEIVEPDGGITYRQITPRYFVVSGLRKGEIFYQRCNFAAKPDDVVDCFKVTYPTANKAAMDPVVARLSRSLRNGGHQR